MLVRMRMREEFEAAHYLTSQATVALEEVTAALEGGFDMPSFEHGSEGAWDYAKSERPGLGFNVTRGREPGVIDSWVAGTPPDSTYQIIVYTRGPATIVDDVRRVLSEWCGMETELIQAMNLNRAVDAPPWGGAGLAPESPEEEGDDA